MRLTALLALLISAHLPAADEQADQAALRAKIMEETRLVAVMDIDVPATSFTGDADPNTLEVVFLSKSSDGPSRVSPDGEVVFLYKASDKVQSDLIGKAFDLRVARTLDGR